MIIFQPRNALHIKWSQCDLQDAEHFTNNSYDGLWYVDISSSWLYFSA